MYSAEKRFTRGAFNSFNGRIKKYCPAASREIIYKNLKVTRCVSTKQYNNFSKLLSVYLSKLVQVFHIPQAVWFFLTEDLLYVLG